MNYDLLVMYTDILKQTSADVNITSKELAGLILDQFGVEVSEKLIGEFMQCPSQYGLIEAEDKRIHMGVLGYA